MTEPTVKLDRAPKELVIYAARVIVKANKRFGRPTDPQIVAEAEWPIEQASDYGQP
jgi:hypothetical protein